MRDTGYPWRQTKDRLNVVARDLRDCMARRPGIPRFPAACVGNLLLQSFWSDSDERKARSLVPSSTDSASSEGDSWLLLTVNKVEKEKVYLNPSVLFATRLKLGRV